MKPRQVLIGFGVVLGGLVLWDLGRGVWRYLNPPVTGAPAPPRTYDPVRFAVQLTGERKARWLKRKPLKVGDTTTPFTIMGADGKKLRIPAADGKPTVLVFTSAARETVSTVSPLSEFMRHYKDLAHVGLVILNTDDLPWDEYRKEYQSTPMVRVWDKDGSVFAKLRPALRDPEKLPMFWGFNGHGQVVYCYQPRNIYDTWTKPLRIALKLPKPNYAKLAP